MANSGSYASGTQLLVKYVVLEALVRARIVCAHVPGTSRHVILTPDGDFYAEDFGSLGATSTFQWARVRPAGGGLLFGLQSLG